MTLPKNYWILLTTALLQVPESAPCLNPVGYDIKHRLLAYIQRLTAKSDILLQIFILTLSPLHWNEVLMILSYPESKDQVLFVLFWTMMHTIAKCVWQRRYEGFSRWWNDMITVLCTNTLCNISVTPPRLEDTFWQSLYTFWVYVCITGKNELQGELDCLVRPFCKYHNCTDRDKLTSAYFVSGVGEDTNHKSSVLCNQFIIWCKYEKKISLCTFSLIHICHSLLELRVCL